MEPQDETGRAPSAGGAKNKKRAREAMLILLALLALFSSVIAGFLIGRNSGPALGQIIDTIVIGPDQSRTVHLAGQVRYADGTPYTGGTVELRSEPRRTDTDAQGRFFYDSVELGDHTLSVVDAQGAVLAACEIAVGRGGSQPLEVAETAEGRYTVELSTEVRFIELAVELRGEKAALVLLPGAAVALQDDGTVFVDKSSLTAAAGEIVLPSGTVILKDSTVVAPGYLILPDNMVTPIPTGGTTTGGGEKILPDGRVELADGTVISAEGIRTPDGAVLSPEKPYQIAAGGQTPRPSPNGQAGTQGRPGQGGSAGSQPSRSGGDGGTSSSQGHGGDGSSSAPAPTPGPTSSLEPTPTPSLPPDSSEPEDDDKGVLEAQQSAVGGWSSWESESGVDLFYNRTGAAANGNIQPGSRGSYSFRLVNSRRDALSYEISLSEASFHLPMRFRLVDADGSAGEWQTLKKGQTLRLGGGTVGAEPLVLGVEWEWLYEGGDDAADTAAGAGQSEEDRAYIVSLKVHAG